MLSITWLLVLCAAFPFGLTLIFVLKFVSVRCSMLSLILILVLLLVSARVWCCVLRCSLSS